MLTRPDYMLGVVIVHMTAITCIGSYRFFFCLFFSSFGTTSAGVCLEIQRDKRYVSSCFYSTLTNRVFQKNILLLNMTKYKCFLIFIYIMA